MAIAALAKDLQPQPPYTLAYIEPDRNARADAWNSPYCTRWDDGSDTCFREAPDWQMQCLHTDKANVPRKIDSGQFYSQCGAGRFDRNHFAGGITRAACPDDASHDIECAAVWPAVLERWTAPVRRLPAPQNAEIQKFAGEISYLRRLRKTYRPNMWGQEYKDVN